MSAYRKIYLYDAKKNLANCLDFAINDQKIDGELFISIFVNAKLVRYFEKGNPSIVAGLSGTEFAMKILEEECNIYNFLPQVYKKYRTAEYWLGYYLAEYQWKKAISFKKIFNKITYTQFINMYKLYHEVSEEKFMEDIDKLWKQ